MSVSVSDEEVRKAIESLLKASAEFPGEYSYDATWGDIERDGCEVGEMFCCHDEAAFVASCCNLAPKLAKFVVEELEHRDQEASARFKPIDDVLVLLKRLFVAMDFRA